MVESKLENGSLKCQTCSNRIEYIDIAKAISIFLVVLGHTVTSISSTKVILYSFHMPLFFILSGFFVKKPENVSAKYIKKYSYAKFKSLMLPFFIWGLIYMQFSFTNFAKLIYGSHEMLSSAHSLTSLWFLPVLYIAFNITYFVNILKLHFNGKFDICVDLIFVIFLPTISFLIPHNCKYGLFWGADIAFIAAAFVILGRYIRITIEKLTQYYILFSLLFFFIAVFSFTCQHNGSEVGYMRMADANYGNLSYCLLNALLGSSIVLIASIIISKIPFNKKLISYIGMNTLGIFLIHKPLISLFKEIVRRIELQEGGQMA